MSTHHVAAGFWVLLFNVDMIAPVMKTPNNTSQLFWHMAGQQAPVQIEFAEEADATKAYENFLLAWNNYHGQ